MPHQPMPGTVRLLRLSTLLPILSIFLLGMTVPWHEAAPPDGLVALLVAVALLPAIVAWLPPLQRWLDPVWLPVAMSVYLGCQALLTSLLHSLGLVRFDIVQAGPLTFVEPGVLLVIPALLIAWQYGWLGALLAAATTGAIHLGTGVLSHWLLPELGGTVSLAPETPVLRPDMLFFLPLLVAYLGGLYRKQQVRQRQAQAQLREFAAAIEVLAVGRERKRLVSRLQETVTRTFALLNEQLDILGVSTGAQPGIDGDSLATTRIQINQEYEKTQLALADLQAEPLEDLGLVEAIRARADSLAQRHGVAVQFLANGSPGCLTAEQELVIYHIAAGALDAAEDHGELAAIDLMLICVPNSITLTVHHQGICQTSFESNHGRDLQHMAACAQLIGGHLCVDRQQESGTTVALWLPCNSSGS